MLVRASPVIGRGPDVHAARLVCFVVKGDIDVFFEFEGG